MVRTAAAGGEDDRRLRPCGLRRRVPLSASGGRDQVDAAADRVNAVNAHVDRIAEA